MIPADSIPLLKRGVTVRREPRGYLLYQRDTDELYFLSAEAFGLCALFDGSRTVGELAQIVCQGDPSRPELADSQQLGDFLEQLAKRSLIELWS